MKRLKTLLVPGLLLTGLLIQPAAAEMTADQIRTVVIDEMRKEQSRTSSVDSPAFNPAIGVVLDAVVGDTTEDKGNFDFRSAEMNFQGTIDPFGRFYTIINATGEGVEVEEAAVVTTALPANLSLRFGRYFANFGRLPKFHDHELPFVNRTPSLSQYIGEARADGVELTHLFRLPFFLQGSLGVANAIGGHTHGHEGDDEEEHHHHDERGRKWKEFTYNARLFTYLPLGDSQGLDIGVSQAFIPKQPEVEGFSISGAVDNQRSYLTGLDLTYRWEPVKNSFRKMTVGAEAFNLQSMHTEIELNTDNEIDGVEYEREKSWGAYGYLEAQLWRRYSVGGFYDYSEDPEDHDNITRSGGVFANFMPSEFQRIRLQYSQVKESRGHDDHGARNHQVYLQWMAIIGRHAHTFKDR